MSADETAAVIRAYVAAFFAKDREAAEELLAEEFRFTSPMDDAIDRAAYFERCWPNSDRLRNAVIEQLFAEGDEAFVRYRVERVDDGVAFHNTEFFRLAGRRIRSVEVYFGAEERGRGDSRDAMADGGEAAC
jgi:ketosteroid isomerase-like protein